MSRFRKLAARWPQARALLICLHLAAVLAAAFPVLVDERGMDREKWRHPTAQREFGLWSQRLDRLGIELEPGELEEALWRLSGTLNRTHAVLQRPFAPYYRLVGTRQNWRMFPAPLLEPSRLEIDVGAEGEWRTVFRLGDGARDWLARQLEHDRVRALLQLYRWELHPRAHDQLVDWAAARAARDFPQAEAMRWRWVRYRILPPGEAAGGETLVELGPESERIRWLDRYREAP